MKYIATASKIPARQQGWPNQPPEKSSLAKWKQAFIVLLTDARLLAILEKGRTNIEARHNVQCGVLGEVLKAIKRKEGVVKENLNKYKRKCYQEANKDANRSKRLRLAGANKEQDNQDQVEEDEAEQTPQMKAELNLPATQEVNA